MSKVQYDARVCWNLFVVRVVAVHLFVVHSFVVHCALVCCVFVLSICFIYLFHLFLLLVQAEENPLAQTVAGIGDVH